MKKTFALSTLALSIALAGCSGDDGSVGPAGASGADGNDGSSVVFPLKVYADYPVTLDPANNGGAPYTQETSVSYSGQMARHALRESVKSLLGKPGETTVAAITTKINNYLKNGADGSTSIDSQNIIAPADKGNFTILETTFADLSSGKSLYSNSFSGSNAQPITGVADADKNKTLGVPGEKTAQEVLDLWVANFARNYADAGSSATYPGIDFENGFEWNQMFAKYLMGAVFYNQSVDKYLDEYIAGNAVQPNSAPYNGDASKHYTGKEHSWDEGFGYFGAAANYGLLDPSTNYYIKKQQAGLETKADWNGDGDVSIYTEYTSGPAYYAADADKSGNSTYGHNIMSAFIAGREVIADAKGSDGYARDLKASELVNLNSYADQIRSNWEKVIAEAVYKYAGSSYNDIDVYLESDTEKNLRNYIHHWSEGKGMMLSLQYGGPKAMIDKATFEEIDGLLGFGPVVPDTSSSTGYSQVTGVTGDTFTRSEASITEYKAKLKEVQVKLDAFYGLKAKKNEIE